METIALAAAKALIESATLPGARTPVRLETWTEDIPELQLNLLLLAEAFLQLLASGLGTLALVWATVVLLGGFSTMLLRTDFWFTTAIVFIETARIVGYNSGPEAKFFVDVPAAFSQKILWVGHAANVVRVLAMGPTWIALAPIFAATACMLLSIIRLATIARHDYGHPSSDASNGNLKPALILFYALVLTQSALFLLWFTFAVNRSVLANKLSSRYLENERCLTKKVEKEKTKLIDRYVNNIVEKCIDKGVYGSINSSLVSFAAELLQSEHPDDYFSAVSVLHSLVITNTERSDKAVDQICSSEKSVSNLIRLLRSKTLDPDTKAYIAEIVAKLACKLRLADTPGAVHCVSYLLDCNFLKIPAKSGCNDDHSQPLVEYRSTVDIDNRAEIKPKPLIVHGLLLLGEFAANPENCTEMYNTTDLVSKIIAPVTNGLHIAIKNDATTVDIVRESLRVVSKLTSMTGDISTKLCRELPENGRTVENIVWILSNSSDPEMRIQAVEILSRLNLGKPRMCEFIGELQRLLFDPLDSPLRIAAGKALNALVISRGDFPEEILDIQQLITIMSAGTYSLEYRAVMAEMLAQMCAKSRTDEDRNRLSSLANALPTVLKTIFTGTTNITEPDARTFLASFLGLPVQIREKLVNAEAFANVVNNGLPTENRILAEKLTEIVSETTNDSEDEVCLLIMKAVTKLATWMMGISPDYIQYFRQQKIVDKLEATVEAMVHLERYLVMTGAAEETGRYVTFQMLCSTGAAALIACKP